MNLVKIKGFKLSLILIDSWLFWILILFNIGYAFSAYNFATMDGSCHLYTSSLFNFIRSDPFIRENYTLTGIVTPNLLSHYTLSLLFNFFDQGLSEKIFICFYFVLVPITFRKAVQLYSKKESNFTLLIFPILYNYLLHIGFYNLNFAFVFFNIHLILLYHLLHDKSSWHLILFYIINIFLLYSSHAFMFLLVISLTAFILIIYSEFKIKLILKKFLLLLSLSIFPLILLFYFFAASTIANFHSDITAIEKLQKIAMGSPLIVAGVTEYIYTYMILTVIILLSAVALYKGDIRKDKKSVFLFFALLIFIAVFFIENGMYTGMMVDRLALVFFYIFIFWLSCYKIISKWLYLFSACVVLFSFLNLYFMRKTVIGDIGADAKKVFFASQYVAPHSYVFNVNLTENWLEGHFGNYLANNKPIVFINDNHASLGWFPFKWKNEKLILEMNNSVTNYDSLDLKRLPDYILVIGNQLKLENNLRVSKCINDNGIKIYSSKDNYCVLYKLNSPTERRENKIILGTLHEKNPFLNK